MELLTLVVVSTAMLLVASVMLWSHVRDWRIFQQAGLDAEELDYRRRQFRRRMQTSAMLGLLAIALPVGIGLTIWLRSGWFFLFFCLGMILAVCWVILLAIVDICATRRHFGRVHDQHLLEKLKLEAERRRREAAAKSDRNSDGDSLQSP
ncbi:MAG: hypothetical protein ABFC96_05570 [Thermoguttaceae bacterium]